MGNNKQSMKLYTEDQLIELAKVAFAAGKNYTPFVFSEELKNITPIELPSDEEIKKYTPYPLGKGFYNPLYSNKWEEGAKWMRDKIGGEQ
jgi:hypothetical protein